MDEIYYVFEAGRPKSVQEGFIFLKHLYLNFVLNFRQRQQITGDRTKEKKIKKKRKKRKERKKERKNKNHANTTTCTISNTAHPPHVSNKVFSLPCHVKTQFQS